MIHLRINSDLVFRLLGELKRAGSCEIGGVIVGEQKPDGVFEMVDFSVQRTGGTKACFVRQPSEHKAFLAEFFEKTSHDYRRFNYLGEWHSHPSFLVCPSSTDRHSMQEIVEDPAQNAAFAMLLICRRDRDGTLAAAATVFKANTPPSVVIVI